MNKDCLEAFQNTFDNDLFTYASNDNFLSYLISEDGKNGYKLTIKFRVKDDYAISFRIENIKSKANYLKGGERSAGKDNDYTIIDDAIYQFEIKKTKRLKNSHPEKQLQGGEKWLRHLLTLVASQNPNLTDNLELPVYNIVIQSRTSLSHSNSIKYDGTKYILIINSAEKSIDLTKIKRRLINNPKSSHNLKLI